MMCPTCYGKGHIARIDPGPPVDGTLPIAGAHHSVFPRLCDQCSGTGEIKPPPRPADDPG